MPQNTLWMRYVQFDKIVSTLRLVAQSGEKLSAQGLENACIQKRIFIRSDGKPFSRSTMYHYRKVMEHLNLLELDGRYYTISTSTATTQLLSHSATPELDPYTKDILASAIVANSTCRRCFFDFMMESHDYQLPELRAVGRPIRLLSPIAESLASDSLTSKPVEKGTTVMISEDGRRFTIAGSDELNAILWGVRLWALDLGITDEMLLWYSNGRLVAPISMYPGVDEAMFEVQKALAMMLRESTWTDDWALVSIPALLETAFRSSRFPLVQLKLGLKTFQQRNPQQVMFVPSTTALIDLRSPYRKQEKLIRQAYVKLENGEMSSHIRIDVALLRRQSE